MSARKRGQVQFSEWSEANPFTDFEDIWVVLCGIERVIPLVSVGVNNFLYSVIWQGHEKLFISHGKQHWVVRNGLISRHNMS